MDCIIKKESVLANAAKDGEKIPLSTAKNVLMDAKNALNLIYVKLVKKDLLKMTRVLVVNAQITVPIAITVMNA